MSTKQEAFFQLAKKYESLKEEMKRLKPELDLLMTDLGVGSYHQDPLDKVVYQIIVPSGMFVYFKTIDYIRTKRTNESKGELSIKKAEEAGFIL